MKKLGSVYLYIYIFSIYWKYFFKNRELKKNGLLIENKNLLVRRSIYWNSKNIWKLVILETSLKIDMLEISSC